MSLPDTTTFASGTNVLSLELAVTVNDVAAVSASPIVNGRAGVATSSVVVWFVIAVMVGASLTAPTAKVKVIEVTTVPSPTLIVIVVDPLSPGAGVSVTVRSEPDPAKTMLPLGTNVVTLDVPVTIRLAAGVSASPILKEIAPVGVFSVVV